MSQPRAPHPALAAWSALRASGASRGALVTLVRADGGAARSLGTHFAVADDGRAFGSLTVGGCADGRAMTAAQRVLETGVAERLTMPVSEEDALALGLGCAGDVDLLVERVSLRADDPVAAAFDAAVVATAAGRAVALVTLLSGGAGRLLVRDTGEMYGGTGDARRDAEGVALGAASLSGAGAPPAQHTGALDTWFVQPVAPVRTLLIVGATEIAAALCLYAVALGWHAVVLDPRDDVLAQPRFAAAAERIACMPVEEVERRLADGATPAVVVVAHDYRVELPVLRAALAGDASYVGMLGSRKRGATVRAMLADGGLHAERIARLRSPIGLAIGAEGPAEIAASIVAEVIATWRGVARGG